MLRRDDMASPVDQLLVAQDERELPESNFGTNSQSAESVLDAAVERSINHAMFGSELRRREFVRLVGAGAAAALVNSILPLGAAKALAQEKTGPIEKKELKVGFIPITCATPIIMAEPMGFYKKHGLDVQVYKASGWAMIRDMSINAETDATHMLTPMPLSISMGIGSLLIATIQHRGDRNALRALNPEVPRSVAALLAGLIAILGVLALLAVIFRQ
jgi:nitrate/nitrite transport system substrate-binding protein